jgi:hypothetical protein
MTDEVAGRRQLGEDAESPPEQPSPTWAGGVQAPLPERPSLTTPRRLRGRALLARERELVRRQPWLGFAGLLVVVPLTLLLAAGAGGAESSLEVVGPLSTFALPVIAMIAFWWEDWPGARLTPGWSGIVNTVVVVVLAIVLTGVGQVVVGRLDLHALFDGTPGAGHPTTFPATLPLAAAAFSAMLQLTIVSEGWPLRALGRLPSGLAALAVAWAVALLAYLLLIDVHPRAADLAAGMTERDGLLSGLGLGSWLICVAVWQAVVFIALRGWPVSNIDARGWRIVLGNALTIAGGWLTYLLLRKVFDVELGLISAAGGCGVAAALIAAMLMEGWLGDKLRQARWRLVGICAVTSVAIVLYVVLRAIADSIGWQKAEASDWISYVGLNAVGAAIILHVAIWRRWPVSGVDDAD